MFTVKWIVKTPHGSITRMFDAEDITVAFRDALPPQDGTISQLPRWEVDYRPVDYALFIMDPHGNPGDRFAGRSLDAGTVYVMNETGATVGKYVLSEQVIDNAQPLSIAA